jgi:cytochrome c553
MKGLIKAAGLLVGLVVGGARGMVQGVRSPEPVRTREREDPLADIGRLGLKGWVLIIGLLGSFAAVGGFLLAASGIIPIKASSGHWPITAWLLKYSMHRSIATHTTGLEAPTLDEPWLVAKGAGHYETGCRPCHGSPELRGPRVARWMTPHPPYLPPAISHWEPAELFYLVKHGVKFTGMPAWPAQQRDDEVWAMVAFLLAFPKLDAQAYRRLVSGEAGERSGEVAPIGDLAGPQNVPEAVIENCGRCHGVDGRGRGTAAFPSLAGQRAIYLESSLRAFARGDRHSGIMEPVAAGLSEEDMRELAVYYGALVSRVAPGSSMSVERGRKIAQEGIPMQRVPACVECHGPSSINRNPAYPVLAGQYAEYLVLQLELFHRGQRGGSEYAHLMHPVAGRLTPAQVREVARYFESLGRGY